MGLELDRGTSKAEPQGNESDSDGSPSTEAVLMKKMEAFDEALRVMVIMDITVILVHKKDSGPDGWNWIGKKMARRMGWHESHCDHWEEGFPQDEMRMFE